MLGGQTGSRLKHHRTKWSRASRARARAQKDQTARCWSAPFFRVLLVTGGVAVRNKILVAGGRGRSVDGSKP